MLRLLLPVLGGATGREFPVRDRGQSTRTCRLHGHSGLEPPLTWHDNCSIHLLVRRRPTAQSFGCSAVELLSIPEVECSVQKSLAD